MERRELLKLIASATGMAMIGLPTAVFGYEQPSPAGNDFSAADVALLDEVAEVILPRTDTPGAKDAGVGLFMAQYVTDCCTDGQQALFRSGLADLNHHHFMALTFGERTKLLRTLDAEARAVIAPPPEQATHSFWGAGLSNSPPHYFTMLKQLTLFGFFTSEVGATQVLRYVAIPGRYDGDMPYTPGAPAWAT